MTLSGHYRDWGEIRHKKFLHISQLPRFVGLRGYIAAFADFRFWHLADIGAGVEHVRFRDKADIAAVQL